MPILWDTRCINNQTPGRNNVTATRDCLATTVGILLVSPANIQKTNAIVKRGKFPSVFYSFDLLGDHIVFTCSVYRASQQTLLCTSKYILRLTKSSPLIVDSSLNLGTLSLTSRVSNHHGYLSNSVKIIFM